MWWLGGPTACTFGIALRKMRHWGKSGWRQSSTRLDYEAWQIWSGDIWAETDLQLQNHNCEWMDGIEADGTQMFQLCYHDDISNTKIQLLHFLDIVGDHFLYSRISLTAKVAWALSRADLTHPCLEPFHQLYFFLGKYSFLFRNTAKYHTASQMYACFSFWLW